MSDRKFSITSPRFHLNDILHVTKYCYHIKSITKGCKYTKLSSLISRDCINLDDYYAKPFKIFRILDILKY